MSLAKTVHALGRSLLNVELGQSFTIGETTFTGLISEAKRAMPAGGRVLLSGEVFFREVLVEKSETAFSTGLLKDGATVTTGGRTLTVAGVPRSYNDNYVMVTMREVK